MQRENKSFEYKQLKPIKTKPADTWNENNKINFTIIGHGGGFTLALLLFLNDQINNIIEKKIAKLN